MATDTIFTPIGDRPRWAYVYDLLDGQDPGTVITYEQMGAALEGFDRNRDRGAISKASARLLRNNQRATEAVPNVGYRIVEAEEHLRLAASKQRQARRTVGRGRKFALHFRRDEVSAEVASRLDAVESTMARQEDMLRRLDKRTARTEELLTVTHDTTTDTAVKVAALEAALVRAGIQVTP
jgi:hypothetical protein